MPETPDRHARRRRWMGILAKARPDEVSACWSLLSPLPDHRFLRPAETGLTMLRGRIAGQGAAFNLGEMTVTRCSVTLADGTIGHAWIAGRHRTQAEQAALLDAVLQGNPSEPRLTAALDRMEAQQRQRRAEAGRKAAATKVDFFTLARGED